MLRGRDGIQSPKWFSIPDYCFFGHSPVRYVLINRNRGFAFTPNRKGVLSNMFLPKILPASIAVALSLAAIVAAQEKPSPSSSSPETTVNANRVRRDGPQREGMRPRMLRRKQREALGQLNLTDEQRQQRQAILQRHLDGFSTQREQLLQLRQKRIEGSLTTEDQARLKTMRQERREAMKGMRGEMLNTLTPDQRSQLEGLREQRKQKREEFMKRRQEFRRSKPTE